jgi:hypothetical protein
MLIDIILLRDISCQDIYYFFRTGRLTQMTGMIFCVPIDIFVAWGKRYLACVRENLP